MYSDDSASSFYNELVVQPFFRNHVNRCAEKAQPSLNRIDREIDQLTEMVERAEVYAEVVPCSDEFCGLPVPRQDVLRCHESNLPYCETCFHEHRKTCKGCQQAQVRMQQAVRDFVSS